MTTNQRAAARSANERPAFLELLTRQGVLDPEEAGLRRALIVRLGLFGVLLAGHVWLSEQNRILGYKSEALGKLIQKLDKDQVELDDMVWKESGPPVLASRAAGLGMQKPGRGQLRRIDAQP